MEKIGILNGILITSTFLLVFSANLSTEHARRRQLYIVTLIPALFFISVSIVYRFQSELTETWDMLFISVGLILPQLVSRMFVRQKIQHPVVFLQKQRMPLITIVPVVLSVFMAWIAFLPSEYNSTTGGPVYDELDVWRSLSFLVFFISFIIFIIQMQIERDAICENGFYKGGLLSDWSNFKSYFWTQGKMYSDPGIQPLLDQNTLVELIIEPKSTFFVKQIQLIIPFSEKNAVESLLSRKLVVE